MQTRKHLMALGLVAALMLGACSAGTDDLATGATAAEPTSSGAIDVVEPEPTAAGQASTVEPDENAGADEPSEIAEDESPSGDGDMVSAAVTAADSLTGLLADDEVDTLSYDYGDPAITTSWSNLPACDRQGRAGIRHGDLSDEQISAVLAVVDAVLSDEGLANYTQIIAADEELGGGDGDVWDADCYYMAFFGTPSTTEPWALQFGGHHYARTVTFADGAATVTPAFTGVEPRSFMFEGETVAPLAAKSERVFAIFDTLDGEQLAAAELSSAQTEILLGPGSDSFPESEGLLLSETSEATQEAVLAAVSEWVEDFGADVAVSMMASFEADLASTNISWSTSTDIDTQDAYARIDGPGIWIEFINERGVGSGEIHQHSVFRDKSDDYGTAA